VGVVAGGREDEDQELYDALGPTPSYVARLGPFGTHAQATAVVRVLADALPPEIVERFEYPWRVTAGEIAQDFGPHDAEVRAFLDRCRALSEDEVVALGAAYLAADRRRRAHPEEGLPAWRGLLLAAVRLTLGTPTTPPLHPAASC
jgi:hypothetical protein